MDVFDVRVYQIRRRADRRRPFEVRWHAAGRAWSRSFLTRGLADSYRAELVRAARKGLEFGPATGEPVLWATPPVPDTTWYQHAVAYVDMKWPHLAAHSRASMAEALATVTPELTRPTANRPPAGMLRAALYGHAFNPHRRHATVDLATVKALGWLERASLPIQQLRDPRVIRLASDALAVRLDGHLAAANTIARKRAVFHSALAYAVELGLLPSSPLGQVTWKAPGAGGAVNPLTVASPAQVHAILAGVTRIRPELTAFFACLYYAALRPEEAVALRSRDLVLPPRGWGKLILTRACPRTGSAWTSTGEPYETRGLKHRPHDAIRIVPIPPVLAGLLRQHLRQFGTTSDGRLFRGTRGGQLSESVYGRTWHAARLAALGPALAATVLARRPYDLRHAALSLWLNATGAPAEVAARAGNSVRVLHTVYTHCLHGQQDAVSQQIEHALYQQDRSPLVTASGPPHRSHRPDPVRHVSVNGPHAAAHQARFSRKTRTSLPSHAGRLRRSNASFRATWRCIISAGPVLIWPTHGPQAVCGTACFARKSR
jgi:integrase